MCTCAHSLVYKYTCPERFLDEHAYPSRTQYYASNKNSVYCLHETIFECTVYTLDFIFIHIALSTVQLDGSYTRTHTRAQGILEPVLHTHISIHQVDTLNIFTLPCTTLAVVCSVPNHRQLKYSVLVNRR